VKKTGRSNTSAIQKVVWCGVRVVGGGREKPRKRGAKKNSEKWGGEAKYPSPAKAPEGSLLRIEIRLSSKISFQLVPGSQEWVVSLEIGVVLQSWEMASSEKSQKERKKPLIWGGPGPEQKGIVRRAKGGKDKKNIS